MYNFYVYNQNKERLGILYNIVSSVWKEQYFGVGEISINVIFDENLNEILQLGNYIHKDDGTSFCQIEFIEKNENAETPIISIKAKTGKDLLKTRTVMGEVEVTTLGSFYDVIEENKRGLNIDIWRGAFHTEIIEDLVYNFVDLGKVADEYLTENGLSYNIDFSLGDNFIFKIVQGTDRRESTNNYVGFFSDKLGNLISSSLDLSFENYSNYAIIKADKNKVFYINEVGSEQRREMLIDMTSFTQEYTTSKYKGDDSKGNPIFQEVQKKYTNERYKELVLRKARVQFNNARMLESMTTINAEARDTDLLKLNQDFFLGDILPLKNMALGIDVNVRVSEIIYTLDGNGYSTVFSLEILKESEI